MEDVLQKVIKEASNEKFAHISVKAHKAFEYFETTPCGGPPDKYREVVVEVIRVLLESGNSRLIALGVSCLQRLVRDDRFHTRQADQGTSIDEERWLTVQVLGAVHPIDTLTDEYQQEILKVLLALSCTKDWRLNGRIVVQILSICIDVYNKGVAGVKAAALATSSQTLLEYGKYLGSLDETSEECISCQNDAITVGQFLCAKLDEGIKSIKSGTKTEIGLVLQSLLTLFRSLPESISKNAFFAKFLWQRFNPTFLVYLGLPEVSNSNNPKNWLAKRRLKLDQKNLRLMCTISVELVRIIGAQAGLRPVLESIFHRMLSNQSDAVNEEAFWALKEYLLTKEDRILKLAIGSYTSEDNQCDSMAIFKLLANAFEYESHLEDVRDTPKQILIFESFHALLTSIETLADHKTKDIDEAMADRILEKFPHLEFADYDGPPRYNYKDQLPTHFVEVIENLETSIDAVDGESGEDIVSNKGPAEGDESLQSPDKSKKHNSEEESGTRSPEKTDCCNESSKKVLDSPNHLQVKGNRGGNTSSNQSSDSEDTEGPEEGYDEDQQMSEKMKELQEKSDTLDVRQKKLPQMLVSSSELSMGMEEEEHLERENAQIFIKALQDELKHLSSARGTVEIDQRLQEFASKFCHEYSSLSSFDPSKTKLILNADGVYITSYSALHLNLKLSSLMAYSAKEESKLLQRNIIPSRDQFVDNILGCGLLIFLSPIWLDEIYHAIREVDIFGFGMSGGGNLSVSLKNVLSDLDGFGNTTKGARLLSDFRRLGPQPFHTFDCDANQAKQQAARERLCRRILTTCWSSFISFLNSTLKIETDFSGISLNSGSSASKMFKRKPTKFTAGELQLNEIGIRCLITATKLCSRLELHTRVGEVLAPLSQLLCSVAATGIARKGGSTTLTGVSVSTILAIENIVMEALELGSQSEDCWKYVMRLATLIISGNNMSGNRISTSSSATLSAKRDSKANKIITQQDDDDDLNLDNLSMYSTSSVSSFFCGLSLNGGDVSDGKSVRDFLGEIDLTKHQALTSDQLFTCINTLNSRIERFFEDAACKLDMNALLGLLRELCFCSHRELLTINSSKMNPKRHKWSKRTRRQCNSLESNLDALLLHRICDVMLKAIKTGRPLVHLIKAWAIVGPHLIEASSHPQFEIAKRSVENIHGIVTSFLQNTSELLYFHFNEALFKPFEHLVRLEICDQAIQDQIVSSICEFVESNGVDIKSGWRPLFGALKHISFSDAILEELIPVAKDPNSNQSSPAHAQEPKETRAVLDVFDAFLSIESTHVFANAALDCIGCLVRHVRGSEERRQLEEIVEIENNILNHQGSIHLGRACLAYLMHCHEILIRISLMPQRPVFAGTHRIHASSDEKPVTIDPTIPYMKVVSFDAATDTIPDLPFTFESLQTSSVNESNPLLKDNAHGLFRLWFILVDGLCSCVSTCGRGYQSSAIEGLFAILASFQHFSDAKENGRLAEFGLFVTNHVLVPMLQNWLRRCGHSVHEWAISSSSFKQCIGKTTELVMTTFIEENLYKSYQDETTLVLKQLLLLLIECTVVPVESIARLGCSCFRHIISSGSSTFDSNLWDIICLSLCRATQVTLYPLHQLMAPFERGSSNFYGDVADVKVAARKDSNRKENHRLQQLAQQVLLLDQQRGDLPNPPANPDAEERSFLFLIHPPGIQGGNMETPPLRIALRSLITGLTANQLILQTIGKVLLDGSSYYIPGLSNIIVNGESTKPSTSNLPGFLSQLSDQQVKILVTSLRSTHEVSMEFDSRPGLKFLVQKVTQLQNAANMYKTAGAAWSLEVSTLFILAVEVIKSDPDSIQKVKTLLSDRVKARNTCFVNQDPGDGKQDDLKNQPTKLQLLVELHDQIIDISETYSDIVADKDGQRARLDQMVREKLLFLSIDPPPPDDQSPNLPPDSDSKPFKFADFACQSIRRSSMSQASDLDSEAPHARKGDQQNSLEEDEEVFSLTTQTDRDNLVSEFRNRKGKKVMPFSTSSSIGDKSSPSSDKRKNPFAFTRGMSTTTVTTTDPEIAAQQKKSLMADSEAQIKVWTDLALAPVELLLQLSDDELRLILPLVFPGLKLLLIHSEGTKLKKTLADLFHRIAILYNFALEFDTSLS